MHFILLKQHKSTFVHHDHQWINSHMHAKVCQKKCTRMIESKSPVIEPKSAQLMEPLHLMPNPLRPDTNVCTAIYQDASNGFSAASVLAAVCISCGRVPLPVGMSTTIDSVAQDPNRYCLYAVTKFIRLTCAGERSTAINLTKQLPAAYANSLLHKNSDALPEVDEVCMIW